MNESTLEKAEKFLTPAKHALNIGEKTEFFKEI